MNRSTKGWESGTQGTVFTPVASRIRRLVLASMEFKGWLIIAAEVSLSSTVMNCVVEHSANRWSIYDPNMYAKASNPARKLIHHGQHPVLLE